MLLIELIEAAGSLLYLRRSCLLFDALCSHLTHGQRATTTADGICQAIILIQGLLGQVHVRGNVNAVDSPIPC